ncbi:MAG: heparan-alpha-glucosaminide N-acetyltransferase domain-containing protein [Melioribacteraceae bacterium]
MAAKSRALYIDLLKGLALVVMIEVHIFNSLLLPEIKQAWWFNYLHFINGLVAPTFTFTSGMVFVLTMSKGVGDLRKFGKDFWKRLSRIGMVFLAAYSLHIPFFSLSKIWNNATFANINSLFTVDVLQAIASGLLVLLIARMVFTNNKTFFNFSGVMTLLILLLGPFAWKIDFSHHIPLFFANYLNRMHGSQFPIFPWWGFIFSGAYIAKYYIAARDGNNERSFANKLIIVGVIFFFAGVLMINVLLPENLASIIPHPFFFIERLGVIMALLGGGWYFLHNKPTSKSILLDVSRESLLVYWLHLQLLYRDVIWGKSLAFIYDDKLNILEATIVTVIMVALMMVIAKAWGTLKQKNPQWARRITITILGGGFLLFLIR